jgi:hypothetical protein
MAVFAYLAFYSIDLLITRRTDDPRATGFLALAAALPAATSVVMLIISLTKLGTTCKLCIGIYTASALCLTGAIVLWRKAKGAPATTTQWLAGMFGVGVLFVLAPVVLYVELVPDHSKFIGSCDGLAHPDDTYGIMVHVNKPAGGAAPALEILDPLCPACKAFEQRLDQSGFADRLDRKAVLFPLDNTCNWMVTETTHPGACTVSEAVLCAGDRAPDVIAWAFEEQDRIRTETKADPAAAARIVKQKFPDLAACVGSPEAKARLNKSLRWSVANNIRVLTPQLFVDNVKLCDEDVDLGLEFAMRVMLDRHAKGTLAQSAPAATPAAHATLTPQPGELPKAHEHAKPTEPDKPAADKPAADKPAVDKPADDKPAETSKDEMPKEEPGPVTKPSQTGSAGGAP